MGFVDKLRGEFIDIIEWVDDSRHTIVWRFPRYHNQIKHRAQLIVRPGQVAVFVHEGRLADVFEPGTYRLETRNLPILATLQGWKHGFESPFKAEVYFAATRQITELKWGTPNVDARALLTELVGTDSEFEAEEISVLLRSISNTAFADMVASSGISVLDLASNYEELSEKLRQTVIERVDDEYGLDIPQLYIVNISLPEEVEKALDTRSSMGIIGDMSQYQQYQLGASMPVAAANPAGGLAGAGVGLGMGMAFAGQMVPGRGGPGGAGGGGMAPNAPAPPPPPAAPVAWYTTEGGRTFGPFTDAQLAEAAAGGTLRPDSLVWYAGQAGWMPAAQVPQLVSLFQAMQPPPPPPSG
jgi:membrane protease subunit (stomatin/prohibitin family)